ncbi:MAG: methyl-accepting chemotaxis protein [Gemmatimonadaceae bacterium]
MNATTIRTRLLAGFGVTVLLLVVAGGYSYRSLRVAHGSGKMEMVRLERGFDLSQRVTTAVLQSMATGLQFLNTGAPSDGVRYARGVAYSDSLRRVAQDFALFSDEERKQMELLGTLQNRIEVRLAVARAYRASGREADVTRVLQRTSADVDEVNAALNVLSATGKRRIEVRQREMGAALHANELLLAVILLLAIGVAVILAGSTSRVIMHPLSVITSSVDGMGKGDLREDPRLRGLESVVTDYDHLSQSLLDARQRLRELLETVQRESDRVAQASTELATAATSAATSTDHVTTAMSDMAQSAAAQLDAFSQVSGAAMRVAEGSGAIARALTTSEAAGRDIRHTSTITRAEIGRAIATLLGAREVVDESSAEMSQLRDATAQIEKFVEIITDIASQTNLLALNAAIEAARAGEEGKGFAVVAEEVRQLADESARAAREVAESVRKVRERVASASTAAEAGTSRMRDVESVATGASEALAHIDAAVARVEDGARLVSEAVESNAAAVAQVEAAITTARDAVQNHAALAQEVAAATEETSATAAEVAATADDMRTAAERVKGLVLGFRT